MESVEVYLARILPSLFVSDKNCSEIITNSIDDVVYFGCSLKKYDSSSKLNEPCNCVNYKTCQIYNKRR
ncbi:MAG: hypothetical protein AB7V77_04630 [Candidatus Woesearchaeota archaeon]